MGNSYKVNDFYFPILQALKLRKNVARPSEIAQEAIKTLEVTELGNSEFWGMARLKLKNRVRIAGLHLAEAGYLLSTKKNTHKEIGWKLAKKAEKLEISQEDLSREVIQAVRWKIAQAKSRFSIDSRGQLQLSRENNHLVQPKTSSYRRKRDGVEVFSKNTVLYGSPATGKTSEAIYLAIKILGLDTGKTKENKQAFKEQISKRVEIITFHPSYRYEDFVEGYDRMGVFKDGILKKIALRASQNYTESLKNESKMENFVLLIDEIHRADVAKVFGELITLIEADKRLGEESELTLCLASGEYFALPPNLYMVGTMNIAERPKLDAVLRRRFEFIPVYPQYHLINLKNGDFLRSLNQQIKELKGSEFMIGHTYFLQTSTSLDFMRIINHQIIPLLKEYLGYDTDILKTMLQNAIQDGYSTRQKFELIENDFMDLELIRLSANSDTL
jgi:5-methylcytosine-specific restriction endonuclease McrBC GTP-binding regulatory subunit McrB